MLDKSKPVGQCIGGVLDGCLMQNNRFYRGDVEVDVNNKPVTQPAKKEALPKGKQVAKEPAIDPQVAEQLKGG